MAFLENLPLLGRLSPVERAKLLPDLREITLEAGQLLTADQAEQQVLFLTEGTVEFSGAEVHSPPLLLGSGAIIGEASLLGECSPWSARAGTSVHLVAVTGLSLRQVLRDRPDLLEEFSQLLLRRKRGLYAVEELAAAPATPETEPSLNRWLRPTALSLATALAIGVWLWPSTGGNWEARFVLAALVWGAVCWLLHALPDYVVALTAVLSMAVVGAASPQDAFSGFASPTWFLLLGVWVIGVAIGRTGLLYRLSLHMLHFLPNTYVGQSFALAITGTLLTPLIPSSQGRTVMAAPLTLELSEAMRFSPRSNGSAGLAMSSFLGFGQMYFLVVNGTTTGILAWSLLPEETRSHATWGFWLVSALPLSILIFSLTYWLTLRLFPAEKGAGISRHVIERQLAVLGPMGRAELNGLLITLLVLGGFITNPIHGVDPAWFALGGMLLLLGSRVVNRDMLGREVDWSFLLFFGATLSIAHVARIAQLDISLAVALQPILAPALGHPLLAVGAVGLLTILLRLALSPIQATPLLAISLIPVFLEAGLNPLSAILAIMVGSTTFIVPALSPGYMAMLAGTKERMFSNRQVLGLALWHSLILLLGLVLSAPFWSYLGAL